MQRICDVYGGGGRGGLEVGPQQKKAGIMSRPPPIRFPRISILDRRHWAYLL